ncbi:MAG: Fe-S cluster assembly protein SufD [Saprospiraceae bacterium]|nr:Fe-S cluster assembly protein SufD [Saprospiraceae bacterium]
MKTDFQTLYRENVERLESLISVSEIRKKGISDFKNKNIPSEKMENWKNFSLKDIYDQEYKFIADKEQQSLGFFSHLDLGVVQETIIFNNGTCTYANQLEEYKNGVIFGSLRAALLKYPQKVIKYLNTINNNENGLSALNSAMMNDGFFIFIPEGVTQEIPFSVIENFNNNDHHISFSRNLIILEKNSGLIIHHSSSTDSNDNSLAVNVTEIFVEESSSLEWNTIQEHEGQSNIINFDLAIQLKNSKLTRNIITLGSYNTRNEVRLILAEPRSYADVNGANLLKGENKLESRVFIDHASYECNSNQLFKGILDDNSNGSFTGKILVRKDSQKTNAFQSTKNILLSEDARMNMNPFLEIYADDVKCSHGASIGNIDTDALFYLRARGISESEAKKILLRSFVLDILNKISGEDFRNYLSEKIVHSLN